MLDNKKNTLDLARRVSSYPEPEMREVALASWLSRENADAAADGLAEIVARGREGGPPFDSALVAFIGLLGQSPPRREIAYEKLAEIYQHARARGHDDLGALFLSHLPAARGDEIAGRVLEAADGRPLTLGERKSL